MVAEYKDASQVYRLDVRRASTVVDAPGLGSEAINRDNPVRPTTQRGRSKDVILPLSTVWLTNLNVPVCLACRYMYRGDALLFTL